MVPYYNRDPKRDHNFDNHPYEGQLFGDARAYFRFGDARVLLGVRGAMGLGSGILRGNLNQPPCYSV